MEVKSGYEQATVATTPEAWRDELLGDHVRITSGESPSLFHFATSGLPYFKVEQLSNSEKHLDTFSTPYHYERGKTVPRGSVIFAKRGAAIALNKVRILAQESFMDTNLMALTPTEELDGEFLYYAIGYIGLWRFADTTSVPQINNKHVKPLPFPLPKLAEQRAIAEVLGDVDALLGSLEQLITKKRDLKQAAMQQLLTGKKRLPGFRGEWEMKRFGEITFPRKERVDPRRSGIQEFCVELEHIKAGTGNLVGSNSTGDNSSLKSVFRKGDVLFGKLRAYLRKYWLADRAGVCSTEIWVFASGARLIMSAYLFQLVQSDHFIESASTAYGTHMPRSDWNVVKNYELRLPSLPEQTAIAEVLSDMDAELAALEQRLAKTRDLKQGLMQELLTGKTRLV